MLGTARPARQYSIETEAAQSPKPQEPEVKYSDLDASKLVIVKRKTEKALQKPEELVFGKSFTGPPSRRN